ncbi:MAG: hypothetical protein ACE5GD_04785 [Candidatus Geothermarchaeales archaeon]
MNGLPQDKRGVGEFTSSLLLIFIMVSLGVGIYAYGSSYFSVMGDDFQLQISLDKKRVEERFVVTATYPDASGKLNIVTYNYGKWEVIISAVYVDGDLDSEPNLSIDVNEIGYIETLNSYEIGQDPVKVTIVSQRGTVVEVQYSA